MALTDKQRLMKQQQELTALQRCQPVPLPVELEGELNGWDSLLDKDFFPVVVAVARCPYFCGLCWERRQRCLSTNISYKSFVVQYSGDDDRLEYEEREFEEHVSCSCQST